MRVVTAAEALASGSLRRGGWSVPDEVARGVAEILAEVRARGDAALVEYTRRFDAPAYEISNLRVPIPMLDTIRALVPREITDALELAKSRIARFHERQRQTDIAYAEEDGSRYGLQRRPLGSVAAYVPGGAPSSLLMSVVPARIAGVGRIVVLTPPAGDGTVHPAMLYACSSCGVDELFAVGGAQAIAAVAFGTQSIEPVEKIVGPGGVWVTEAKRQVFGTCGIDALAGPAELAVVADEGANSEYVVGELLAQAERAGAAQLVVLSQSRPLLEAVAQLLDTLELPTLERGELVSHALAENGQLIEAASRDEIFEVLDRLAPAYLCLQVRDVSAYLPRIRCAGAVFVGDMTPLICGDYLAGINHVVPASGTARFSASLSLAAFMRSFSVVENSLERVMNDAPALSALAELEGLPHHAQTARMRYGG